MSLTNFETIYQRPEIVTPFTNNVENAWNLTMWKNNVNNTVKLSTNKENKLENIQKINKLAIVDVELQTLSQKIMRETWGNKEDEFWNTY